MFQKNHMNDIGNPDIVCVIVKLVPCGHSIIVCHLCLFKTKRNMSIKIQMMTTLPVRTSKCQSSLSIIAIYRHYIDVVRSRSLFSCALLEIASSYSECLESDVPCQVIYNSRSVTEYQEAIQTMDE